MKQIALLHGKPSRLKASSNPIRVISKVSKKPLETSVGDSTPRDWQEDNPAAFLGPGGECKGIMVSDGKTRIDGNMEGEVHSNGQVIVGEQGNVAAKVKAESVITQGHMSGKVTARKNMYLMSSAVVMGSVTTPHLSMEEGAVLETDWSTGWSLWINGGRIPGKVWREQYQNGAISHPPWWPSEVGKPHTS